MARSKLRKVTSTKRNAKPLLKVSPAISPLTNRLNLDLNDRRSTLNLLLGVLVLAVLAVLVFNYFSKNNLGNPPNLGPAQQTENIQTQISDVTKNNLPGKYTVKEGDTLFLIAQKYYDDGYKFTELVKANKLEDENMLAVGQVLEIPKLDQTALAVASPSPVASPDMTESNSLEQGTGGAINQTIWGERISDNTYTVQQGDWLSKIAGRAYGDVMAFNKIAQANNISNPDLIEVGMVLKIPR